MKLAQLLPEAFVCAEPQETQRAFFPFPIRCIFFFLKLRGQVWIAIGRGHRLATDAYQ